jgi:hypothetical protein
MFGFLMVWAIHPPPQDIVMWGDRLLLVVVGKAPDGRVRRGINERIQAVLALLM